MINLQLPYSLVQREIETEHVPMGQSLGLGVTAWSPLAGGFLTGKYRNGVEGRFADPDGHTWTDREWQLLKPLEEVAGRLGVTMAQVAINWVATQPGVASAIVGASTAGQLGASMAALDFEIPAELRALLDDASAVPPASVYRMFTPGYQN
jgi:aryl-alcohol dehydrogenase-like predicted oxidoreductase